MIELDLLETIHTPTNEIGSNSAWPENTLTTGRPESTSFLVMRCEHSNELVEGNNKYGTAVIKIYSNLKNELNTNKGIFELLHRVCSKEPIEPSSIRRVTYENKNRKYVEYLSEFTSKWESKKEHFEAFTKGFVWDKFKTIIEQFLQFKTDYISFELTDDCSIFFSTRIKGRSVYLETFFDAEVEDGVETVVNIYRNGKVKLAYGGTVGKTFAKINDFFDQAKVNVSTTVIDELSNAYITSTTL